MACPSAHLPIVILGEAAAGEGSDGVQQAWTLFATTALLLILFVLVVALIAIGRIRRQRSEQRRKADEQSSPDAWEEAGRRAKG